MRIARRATCAALTISVCFLLLPSSASAQGAAATPVVRRASNGDRAAWAAGYVSLGQRKNGSIPAFSPIGSTADAIIAYVLARRGPTNIKRAVRYLKEQVTSGNVTTVGLQAKVALALVAAGKNPEGFGGHDLIAEIQATEQGDGRYGPSGSVFDQADAILAILAADGTPSSKARQWLADAQCADGGWQYDGPPATGEDEHCVFTADPFNDWFSSDTNTTALAVMALHASGGGNLTAVDPFNFFTSIRDLDHGGWGYTWGFSQTDSNSTSLVIMAYEAANVSLPDGAFKALKALQYGRCGAFAYGWTGPSPGADRTGPDLGATIGSIPGLLREDLPVKPQPVLQDAPAPIGCPL